MQPLEPFNGMKGVLNGLETPESFSRVRIKLIDGTLQRVEDDFRLPDRTTIDKVKEICKKNLNQPASILEEENLKCIKNLRALKNKISSHKFSFFETCEDLFRRYILREKVGLAEVINTKIDEAIGLLQTKVKDVMLEKISTVNQEFEEPVTEQRLNERLHNLYRLKITVNELGKDVKGAMTKEQTKCCLEKIKEVELSVNRLKMQFCQGEIVRLKSEAETNDIETQRLEGLLVERVAQLELQSTQLSSKIEALKLELPDILESLKSQRTEQQRICEDLTRELRNCESQLATVESKLQALEFLNDDQAMVKRLNQGSLLLENQTYKTLKAEEQKLVSEKDREITGLEDEKNKAIGLALKEIIKKKEEETAKSGVLQSVKDAALTTLFGPGRPEEMMQDSSIKEIDLRYETLMTQTKSRYSESIKACKEKIKKFVKESYPGLIEDILEFNRSLAGDREKFSRLPLKEKFSRLPLKQKLDSLTADLVRKKGEMAQLKTEKSNLEEKIALFNEGLEKINESIKKFTKVSKLPRDTFKDSDLESMLHWNETIKSLDDVQAPLKREQASLLQVSKKLIALKSFLELARKGEVLPVEQDLIKPVKALQNGVVKGKAIDDELKRNEQLFIALQELFKSVETVEQQEGILRDLYSLLYGICVGLGFRKMRLNGTPLSGREMVTLGDSANLERNIEHLKNLSKYLSDEDQMSDEMKRLKTDIIKSVAIGSELPDRRFPRMQTQLGLMQDGDRLFVPYENAANGKNITTWVVFHKIGKKIQCSLHNPDKKLQDFNGDNLEQVFLEISGLDSVKYPVDSEKNSWEVLLEICTQSLKRKDPDKFKKMIVKNVYDKFKEYDAKLRPEKNELAEALEIYVKAFIKE